MAVTCGACGTANRAGARFCDTCGASLTDRPTPAENQNRRTVTVLFTDVTGSTGLGERLDPESLRDLMTRFFALARSAIERHGGTVEKYIGDAVMAVFGIPVAHEDDALRAVRAADELSRGLAQLNSARRHVQGLELALRTGINTGEVVVGGSAGAETLVTGDAVNVAARLQQAAEPDEILLGSMTERLVRHAVETDSLGQLALKGKSQPVAAFRLRALLAGPDIGSGSADRPIVGRRRELAQLRDTFAGVVADTRTHLFTLLGSAGVGKSRLVREFLSDPEVTGSGATIVRGRCLPYGEGLTYWPIAEAVRALAGIAEADGRDVARSRLAAMLAGAPPAVEPRIAEVLGLVEGGSPADELRFAIRTTLELAATTRPLIVLIDDLQWAEEPLLDLVENVADYSRDAPILLLCLARPELLDVRPGWSGGKVNATTILLEPLPARDTASLVEQLLGGGLPDGVRERVSTAAEGNPLFAEEFSAMLADEGLIVRSDDGWRVTGDLTALVVPPTIQAVLAARLDRLPHSERVVAGRASVVGRVFEAGAVAAMSPDDERDEVRDRISSLMRKELVRPDRPGIGGFEAYRFRHLLIRDAAYEGLSKLDRAALHERFAGWLLETSEDRLIEYEEIVGYHLREAFRYRIELGLRDERASDLASRAAAHLGSAGRRAAAREDVSAAGSLLGGALELVDPGSTDAAHLAIDLADALIAAGAFDRARTVLDGIPPPLLDEPDLAARARLQRARILFNTDPASSFAAIDETLVELVAMFERLGDEQYRVKALRWRWFALFARGRAGEAGTFLDEAARSSIDHGSPEWLELARWAPLANAFGPMPASQAIAQAESLLATVIGHPAVEATVLLGLGIVRVMAGDTERGFTELADGTARLESLGQPVWQGGGLQLTGYGRLMNGQPAEAEAVLREADELLGGIAETGFRSTVLALLGVALAELDRPDEAAACADQALALGARDDIITHVLARCVRARVSAARRNHEAAIAAAEDAVAVASTGDYATVTGDALVTLARVLLTSERREDALAAGRRAAAIFRAKGNRLGEAEVDRLLSATGEGSGASVVTPG